MRRQLKKSRQSTDLEGKIRTDRKSGNPLAGLAGLAGFSLLLATAILLPMLSLGNTHEAPEAMAQALVTVPSAEGDPDAIEAGRRIYGIHCWSCHGTMGEGGIGAKLRDTPQIHGDTYQDLVNTITNGVADQPMGAWAGKLTAREILEVAAFVQSLRGTRPDEKPGPRFTLM